MNSDREAGTRLGALDLAFLETSQRVAQSDFDFGTGINLRQLGDGGNLGLSV